MVCVSFGVVVGRTLRCEENLPSTGTSSLTVSFFLGAMLDVSQWTPGVLFVLNGRCGLGGGDATVLSLAHVADWVFAWIRSIQPQPRWGTYRSGWVANPGKRWNPSLSFLVSNRKEGGWHLSGWCSVLGHPTPHGRGRLLLLLEEDQNHRDTIHIPPPPPNPKEARWDHGSTRQLGRRNTTVGMRHTKTRRRGACQKSTEERWTGQTGEEKKTNHTPRETTKRNETHVRTTNAKKDDRNNTSRRIPSRLAERCVGRNTLRNRKRRSMANDTSNEDHRRKTRRRPMHEQATKKCTHPDAKTKDDTMHTIRSK